MKLGNGKWFVTCLGLVVALLFAFSHKEETPFQRLSTQAHEQTYEFARQCVQLRIATDDYKFDKISLDSLRRQFLRTRLAFKRVEIVLAYFYPSFTEDHLNGAPLLKIARQGSLPYVVPPEGLQVLDEMIFSEEIDIGKNRAQALILAQKLETAAQQLARGFSVREIRAHELCEALRLELIRMFSLGLTGFDTPFSGNALQETRVSLEALEGYSAPFLSEISALEQQEYSQLFEAARTFLEESEDFETLDRLAFLTQYTDPLFQVFGTWQQKWGKGLSSAIPTSLNPSATSLFDPDLLDPYFFAGLSQDEDREGLRQLGEKLFYDPSISGGGELSCASCHQPEKAFSDGESRSISQVQGKRVLRNAPSLLNTVYADRFFYDLRAFTLEQQVEHVIFNKEEFNTAYDEIVAKLKADSSYTRLFIQALGAFPDREGFSKALASYVLSLRSHNSPFDRYVRGEEDEIPEAVRLGFNLFMGKAACGTCHFAPTFSGLVPPRFAHNESEILGVPRNPYALSKKLGPDMGRSANEITSEYAWIFDRSFKTPSIRNVGQTAPYFHNGAYQTLENVMQFYNQGGGIGLGLEVPNQTLSPEPLGLNETEQQAIIAFMEALSSPM